jgi:ubiquinone/menaquinone biosynthesis C-methylase UbiE
MELTPATYHWFVRPTWLIRRYNEKTLKSLLQDFNFSEKKILDFGCGIGSNSYIWESDNYKGIDINLNRINYAKKLNKNYHYYTLEGNSLPFNNKAFDFIFLMAVLHHIPPEQIRIYLQEFRRVLRPKGRMIIIEPCFINNKPISNWLMNLFDRGKYIGSDKYYLELFKKEEFKIQGVKKFKKGYFYNELFFTADPN